MSEFFYQTWKESTLKIFESKSDNKFTFFLSFEETSKLLE